MSQGPDIASLLAGLGGGQGGPPGGGPQDVLTPGDTADPAGGPGGQGQPGGDQMAADLIQQILDLIAQAKTAETDQADKLALVQVETLLQKLLAKDQKEVHDLLQGKMPPGAMVKALGG